MIRGAQRAPRLPKLTPRLIRRSSTAAPTQEYGRELRRLSLPSRAIAGGSTRLNDDAHFLITSAARLAVPMINASKRPDLLPPILRFMKIAKRVPGIFDRVSMYAMDGSMKRGHVTHFQPVRSVGRRYFSIKQNFRSINVAAAGHLRRIHQPRFDSLPRAAQPPCGSLLRRFLLRRPKASPLAAQAGAQEFDFGEFWHVEGRKSRALSPLKNLRGNRTAQELAVFTARLRYQAIVRSRPVLKSTLGSYPNQVRAREISA